MARSRVSRRPPSSRSSSLFGPYGPQTSYYATKFPGALGVRSLVLALTDTLYRSFYETFRDLAVKHGVYIAATMNAAPARRVDASQDPALVSRLRTRFPVASCCRHLCCTVEGLTCG